MSKQRYKVIQIVRSVGATSMPWNDLHATIKRLEPGVSYPPAVVGSVMAPGRFRWLQRRSKPGRYYSCGLVSALWYIKRIAKMCAARNRRLVIHVHNPVLAWLAAIAKFTAPNIAVVGNLHTDWACLGVRHRIELRLLAVISRHFICVSNACMRSIPPRIRSAMQSANKVSVIKNGIDARSMTAYSAANVVCHAADGEQAQFNAAVVARMVEAKNCLFVLRILAQSPVIRRLTWYGDGPLRDTIAREIRRLGIESRIVLLGTRPRDEVFAGLMNSEIYLSASSWEGIGVANIEAAALGCQPFLSKIPPHDEIAESLGIETYPLDDVSAWIEAINRYVATPVALRMDMRLRMADTARRVYDIDASVRHYIDIYRNVIRNSYVEC